MSRINPTNLLCNITLKMMPAFMDVLMLNEFVLAGHRRIHLKITLFFLDAFYHVDNWIQQEFRQCCDKKPASKCVVVSGNINFWMRRISVTIVQLGTKTRKLMMLVITM